jgi:hypothetical protein
MRDAMLASAGRLDRQRPAGSPAMSLKMAEMRDNGPEAGAIRARAEQDTHRGVYLPLLRGLAPHALEAFDPVEQTLVTGRRDVTTVPGQALYLLNSAFVRRQSLALAERLLADGRATDAGRVREAYRRTLGRTPTEKEVGRARAYLAEYEGQARDWLAANPAPKPPAGEDAVRPKDARSAAWLSFVQALFGSAEFRYLK